MTSQQSSSPSQNPRSNQRLNPFDESKIIDDDPSMVAWLQGADRKYYDLRQLEYARKYQAEYHDFKQSPTVYLPSCNSNDESSSVIQADSQSISSDTSDMNRSAASFSRKVRRGRVPYIFQSSSSSRSCINELEQTSTIMAPTEPDFDSSVSVHDLARTYFKNYKINTTLPIHKERSLLINSINSYNIVLVKGNTGCGKTTQVPCYILEDAILERKLAKAPIIYVTQPRRIAAKSIAKRVADEHDWQLGELVGYHVGLEKLTSDKTILTYCTSGVLLQKLIAEKSLKAYTHIVIDEAHERDADTDLLMMMIRTLMRKEQSFFRLVVMSATIEIDKLRSYFTYKTLFGHDNRCIPSTCRIGKDKSTISNEIQIIYLDNLNESFRISNQIPSFDLSEPDLFDDCLAIGVKIVVQVIPNVDTFSKATQTVLVFLPGLAEITKFHRMLQATDAPLDIIPLHSCLAHSDQNRIFFPSENGYRKVILATNIAESSITVKDAGFIVDFCLTKTLKKDERTRFPMLKLDWCSRDKLIQRAGRTGRCCPGKVFRLITSHFYHKTLPEYAVPELLVAPLELSVLKIKNFDMGEVKALLAVVLDPPPLQEIKTAVLELKQIGAMTAFYKGHLSDEDGDLTELGRVISNLPIDVHLSKLILLASLLDVLQDAIIVAASLSTNRTVVKHLYNRHLECYENKLRWSKGSQSDLFVSRDVYKEYIYYKDELKKDSKFMESFCNNKHLDERKLQEITALVNELTFRLENQNIRILDQPNRVRNLHEDELMLKVAFCAAFYPNYFLSQAIDPLEVERELIGFDPTRTVVLHNFPVGQVPLYMSHVMGQLQELINRPMDYFADQSKAIIRIDDEEEVDKDIDIIRALGVTNVVNKTTKIKKSLLFALKSAETNSLVIREYKPDAAFNRMKYYNEARAEIQTSRLVPSLLRLVVGRDANNGHITDTTDNEYTELLRTHYYAEVDFNMVQDECDMNHLEGLELREGSLTHRLRQPLAEAPLNYAIRRQIKEHNNDGKCDDIFAEYRNLRGPTSPIQMRFEAVLRKSKGFNVDIDPNSVNSILLDPDYLKCRRQMLVAASVCQTAKSNRVVVKDTSMMPNIQGLPTIMSLLFARNYRLIYNTKLKCFSGAIFSLGWNEDGETLRRDYEIELDFDVHIINDDLELINIARRHISTLIQFIEVNNPGAPKAKLQQELRQIIMTLIKRRRHPLKPIDIQMIDWKDGNFVKDLINVNETVSNTTNGNSNERDGDQQQQQPVHLFLPPLRTSNRVEEADLIQLLRQNLNLLDTIEAGRPIPLGGIQCLLCGGGLGQLYLMRSKLIDHVNTDDHIRLLEQFEKSEERARLRSEMMQQQQQ